MMPDYSCDIEKGAARATPFRTILWGISYKTVLFCFIYAAARLECRTVAFNTMLVIGLKYIVTANTQ